MNVQRHVVQTETQFFSPFGITPRTLRQLWLDTKFDNKTLRYDGKFNAREPTMSEFLNSTPRGHSVLIESVGVDGICISIESMGRPLSSDNEDAAVQQEVRANFQCRIGE